MNNFCVMRFMKYQKNALAKVDRHNNDRKHLKDRTNKELEKYNITRKKYDMTMTQLVNKKIKEIKERTGKTTAKNRVCVAEFVLTFSPDKTEDILARKNEWIKDNLDWIKEEFETKGAELVRFDFHMDEKTPHLHAFILTTDEKGMFNGSRFFAKKSMLENYQDSYAKKMAPFGLERGISKKETRARHKTKTEYLKENIKKIENDIEKLKTDSERINQKQQELKRLESILNKKTEDILQNIFNEDKAHNDKAYNRDTAGDDVLGL